jgi:hypothetical protein
VYCLGRSISFVRVSPTSKIRELAAVWPDTPVAFLYNGVLLLEAMTFEFYGVSDSDLIIVAPAPSGGRANPAVVAEQKQATAEEPARLRDLKLTRMERKPKTFRRFVRTYENAIAPGPWQTAHRTVIPEMSATSPSEDPLPVSWRPFADPAGRPRAAPQAARPG